MGRGRFTEEEINYLKKSPYVTSVDEMKIIYSNEFKFHFMSQYNKGKKPAQIFREAGLHPEILGSKRIERAAARWKESYRAGSLGAYDYGKGRTRRTGKEEWALKFEEQRKQIQKLEDENRKLRAALSEAPTEKGEST